MVAIEDVVIPDSKLASEVTQLVRDSVSELLFNHSSRAYCFAAMAAERFGLTFDPELLYVGAMFHDMGLTAAYSSRTDRFEVDSANAARAFLRQHGIDQQDIDIVWTAIALHSTPGISQYMHPVVALVAVGVKMDVVGAGYEEFTEAQRRSVVRAFPREPDFEEGIIRAFYEGIRHKPETTFGTINAEVLADMDPHFHRPNLCSRIRSSPWRSALRGR